MNGMHDFENALKTYETIIAIAPNFPKAYCGKSSVLCKTGKLNQSLLWLQEVKKSQYYKIHYYTSPIGQKVKDDFFVSTINTLITDTKIKIKNNYKYKPQKETNCKR